MGTRIKTHITPKMRIISFVLAFVMVFVGLPYVGGNMEVKAEETGPNIYSDTKYSNIMGTSGHDVSTTEGHRYHYTGKITKAKVTMFDYVSDYEISGNYNQCWQNEQGYVDAYQGFNSWISNSSPSFDNSATSNSITVTYKSEYFASSDSVKAHIWRGSNEFNDIPMTYDSTTGKFTCTFTPGNGICYPQAILFYKGNISGSDKTSDYNINMQTNHKYEFADRTQFTYYDTESKDPHGGLIYLWADGKTSKSTNIYWKQDVSGGKWYAPHGSDHRRWYWTESWLPTKFKVQDASNNWNTGDKNFNGSIKRGWTNVFDKDGNLTNSYFPAYLEADIDYSKYTNPLYFGCFWMDNEPSGYTRHNTPSYNNFWWQANIGFKPNTNNRGNASVQGLVKSELSGGAAGKLMDVRSTDSNPVELPYFSKTFNNTYIKYYDKDNTGDNINFPFYESYIAANSSYISAIVSGSDTANEQAKFYQFCSKDSNLQFVTTDVNDHKGYFTETTTPIKHGDTQDFLPFNATDSHDTTDNKDWNNHNLGFGAKFETTFKLQRDGCVGATKLEDGSLVDVDSDTRIHTIFEFTGDDDLWVFIDGNLVLDMGGAHLESNGIIDFATKTATAHRARTLGDGVSLQDLNLDYQEKSIDFTSLLKPDSFYTDTETGNTYYNPNVSHTLTVFYMERGMLDSNLLIRFNYSPEANFSKMKITEVTDFDNINEGLKNATMKAAEDDVFMYTVTNTNTKSEDVKTNSARFPVAAQSIRTNQSVTTQLTPGTGSPGTASIDFVPGAQDVPTAVANTSYLWVDEFADNSKIVGKSNGSGQLYLMYGTCKNLYPSAEETKVGKESSAEFEKQFTRNSTMAVLQSDTLYKPNRASSPGLFGDSNSVTGNRLSSVPTATRSVSAYYETTKIVKDRDKNTIPFINESNGTFTFNNDASVDAGSSVMLTEYFTNTPRTGAITIKKELPIGEIVSPANKAFTIKVRFEDVFGVSGVHADVASEYEQIKYKVYNNSGQVGGERTMGSSTMKVGGQTKTCGTISLGVGQWAAIENIPYNTKYIVDENEPYYAPDVTGNNTNVLEGTINGLNQAVSGNNATVKNFSHTLTIKEVTDFSGVNAGLISYTKTAAEKDVFKYTVSNQNTSSSQVVDSGVLYPTYADNVRTNTDANGNPTTTLTSANMIQDTTHVYFDVSRGNYVNSGTETPVWNVSGRRIVAWIRGSATKPNKAVELERVDTNLYRFDAEDYTGVKFILLKDGDTQTFPKSTYPNNIFIYTLPNSNTIECTYQVNTFEKGITYKVRWSQSGSKWTSDIDNTIRYIQPSSYNYDPSSVSGSGAKPVKDTSYVWKDAYTANDMTNITDGNGNLYLMHGTKLDTTVNTTERESSAKFYNQFARGSTMTVEQDGTLTSPNGGTPDTLQANNQRGAGTSRATYYTTTKTLEGSTTSSSLTNNVLPTGTNDFAFNNGDNDHSIHITETFTNSINTGTLKITKEIDPTETTNDTQTNAEFTFKITLTNVFGVTNNNVLNGDYDDIIVKKNGNSYTLTPAANSSNNYATFTLNVGDVLTIEKIPVGTHYVIEELSNDDSTKTEYNYELNKIYKKVDTSSTTGTYTEQTGAATITGDIVSGETHDFKVDNKRKVGPLVLSKTVNGGTNANSGNQTNGSFTFKVELTEPTGVTFGGNYMTEAANLLRIKNDNYDFANHKYTFYETVTGGGTVMIPSVPYGTAYNVTEVYYDTATSTWKTVGSPDYPDPDHPDVSGNHVTGTIGQSLTVANTNAAEITNTYRKVTLTKLDSKDNDTSTGFKVDSAKYILLKLKDDLVITDAVKNIFASAESITDLHPEGEPSNLFYQDFSTEFTTGDTTKEFGSGQIVVRDSDITHGLTAGKYFFFETAAAGDNYDVDNTLTDAKIIEINATNDTTNVPNYTYTVDHTDPRKTGSLKLQKRLDDGTSDSTTEFTYHVELTNESTDVNLTKYMTQTPTAGIDANISGAAQAVSIANADYNAHKIAFDVKVIAGTDVTISGLPYDTTYDVLENLSSDQIALGWKKVIAEEFSDSTKTIDSTATDTVKVTNALIGDLKLKKVLGSNAATNEIQSTTTFYFEVILTPPSTPTAMSLNDFITNYIGSENVGGTDATSKFIKIDSDTKLKRIFTIAGDNAEHTEIIGLPYGTTYSVVEADESQNKTASIVYALNGTIGAITDKVIGANNVVTTTNNYPQLGSLNIAKTITGDNAPDDQQFTFTVTLTPQKETLIDLKDFTFTNTGGIDFTVSSDHKTITVKLTGGNNVIISGIPVGTVYAVSEGSVDDWTQTASSGTNGTISDTVRNAAFTNNYATSTPVTASLTITKTDTNGTAITSSPATYYLLKLNSTFDADYENDPAAISNTFKNAGSVSDLNSYYDSYYGPRQTDSSGQVVFDTNDSGLTIATGDKFFFFEAQAPYGYKADNALTYTDYNGNVHTKIIEFTADDPNPEISYPNAVSAGVTIHKTNPSGEGLADGEFDLYYKDQTYSPTYSYNEPEVSPTPEATTKIKSNIMSIPSDAAGTQTTTHNYTYSYGYPNAPTMPYSTETDWILPRSDNDYIYFRDYNTGTQYSGDNGGFESYGDGKKYRWINTWFEKNVYGQREEIGYDHRYWIAAQFTKDGSGYKGYAVWERFVEDYNNEKAVIWKIQPPDGYNKVRFCLYDGSQCIRTTEEITYVLGDIYTKSNYGNNSSDRRWNYPVTSAHWSTSYSGAGETAKDARLANTTGMNQAKRYTATDQKVIFHCNSKQVWHNIHIQFFYDDDGTTPLGQEFPGYMMEPYAYANEEYRIKGYLTYELTIPKGAKSFQINNGANGTYNYRSAVMKLYNSENDPSIEGRKATSYKNYHNYFKLNSNGAYNVVSGTPAELKTWSNSEIKNAGDSLNADYSNQEVESDYDYIYFEKPGGWSEHVYAYFYGGGDLRGDNWQRACYSIWPGVAPVATEYNVTDGTAETYHSDIYTYEYTGSLYSETKSSTGSITNPETKISSTIYKFKIPKGELKNYSKVIFNDGLKRYSNSSGISSNNETSPIKYRAGYLYSPSNTKGTKYYDKATVNYNGRGDYLYIRNDANWDNMHITFYDTNGTQILQKGNGYIMQYAGVKDSNQYFRIPIPSNAAHFKLNNGTTSNATALAQIYPKQTADTSKKDYTTGNMVYTLAADKSLTKTYPNFDGPSVTDNQTITESPVQESNADYDKRGDKLYIRNSAGWTIGKKTNDNAGAVVKFYNGNTLITTTNVSDGKYLMIQSNTEDASQASSNRAAGTGSSTAKEWYSIDIPINATKFTLTYNNNANTTGEYNIYPYIDSDGSTDPNYKWTNNGMYYETVSGGTLNLISPTFYKSVEYTGTDNYTSRGDDLYLVVSNLDEWKDMRVTFYDENGEAFKNTTVTPNLTEIVPNYLGHLNYNPNSPTDGESTDVQDAAGYWFRTKIPTDALSFKVTSPTRNSDTGEIFPLKQNRTYQFSKDYTPGDMQYRITDTLSGGEYNLNLIYPIFTEDSLYHLKDHEEINSSIPTGGEGVDASQVSGYNTVAKPSQTQGSGTINNSPVLYPTSSDTITYTWEETTETVIEPTNKTISFINSVGWSTVKVRLFGGDLSGNVDITLDKGSTSDSNGYYTWSKSIASYKAGKVIFYNGTLSGANRTNELSLVNYGYGSVFTPYPTSAFPIVLWINNANDGQMYAHFWNDSNEQYKYYRPDNWNSSDNSIKNNLDDEGQNYSYEENGNHHYGRWWYVPSGYNHVLFYKWGNNSDSPYWQTVDITLTPPFYGKGVFYDTLTTMTGGKYNVSLSSDTHSDNIGQYITGTLTDGQSSGTTTTTVNKTATYQPEDRYGYINSISAMTDYTADMTGSSTTTDNFVKVTVTGIDTPYIRFYDASDTIINITTTSDVTNAVGLKVTKMTVSGNDYTGVAQSGPYTIRIPKGAKKISVGDGTNWSSLIPLYTGYANEFTANKSGSTVSISQDESTSRTTHTTALQSYVTTDNDYIFLKDDADSDRYAYYYGGSDGEYCAWPGVVESFRYQDNDGKYVHAFQIPTESGSRTKVYPYVTFNSGTVNSSTGMTWAISYTGGTVYTIGSTGGAYGTWSATPYTTTPTSKTSTATTNYSSTKYIYMIDNGTKNLASGLTNYTQGDHYALDDIHVEFFSDAAGMAIQTANPGYVMDKVGTKDGSTVYRIAVPDGATHFRINNGQGKATQNTGSSGLNNDRHSEIKEITENGLYRFVQSDSTPAPSGDSDYIKSGDAVPADLAALSTPAYLLELVNKKPTGDPEDMPDPEGFDVHLATIVTDENGTQKYIKWLKPKPGAEDEVDTVYLDHTSADIGESQGVKEVRVKKIGTYYWVETKAPAGYKVDDDKITFTVTLDQAATGTIVNEIVDDSLNGKVLLTKTAKEKVGSSGVGDVLEGAKFSLYKKTDTTNALVVARKTNTSEYYLIPDISAGSTDESKKEYIALSQSGEYAVSANDITITVNSASVTVKQLEGYTELVTDDKGHIKIENLPWDDYVLIEQTAPNGFVNTTNGSNGANSVYLTIGKNNSDITNEVSVKNEMNPAYIKLFEHINERRDAWGDPTFTFKIKQTHEYVHTYNNGTWTDTLTEIPDYLQKEILVSLTVNDDGTLNSNILRSEFENWLVESTDEFKDTLCEYQGMYHIDSQGRIRVEPGSYEITRMPVSRYEFVTSAYTNQYNNGGTAGNQTENLDNNNAPLEKVTISGLEAGKTIDVHYYDKVGYYDKFSQVGTKINKFYTLDSNKNNTTVKGIRIDDYYVADSGTVSGDTLTVDTSATATFKAYKIMADGTEQQITGVDLAKLDISYNYESGSKDDEQFDTDFSYSNPTITVNNAPRYHDSVYKLNVSYDNKFTTTFNLVFEKQSTNVTYYTAQIIFKNDSQDSTSHDPSNISYFEEGNNRTHAYEFTFVIADDNGTKTVSDIRHNGASIGTSDSDWTSALSTMNSSFNILSGYSYSLDSWVQLAPSSPSLTYSDYSGIVTYLTGSMPGNIEFAAHLTSP